MYIFYQCFETDGALSVMVTGCIPQFSLPFFIGNVFSSPCNLRGILRQLYVQYEHWTVSSGAFCTSISHWLYLPSRATHEVMISNSMVIERRTTYAMVEQSWVQSQHPTTEWNLRGGRWNSEQQCMENKSKKFKKGFPVPKVDYPVGIYFCKSPRSKIHLHQSHIN